VIESPDAWLLDTDIQIHRIGLDPEMRTAAEEKRKARQPAAVSAYSLLEFKGNYIADLILVRRKVADSADIQQVFSRVLSTGGRKCTLMLVQLVKALGDMGFDFKASWGPAQGILVTMLDAEVASAWVWFKASVDRFVDDLNCTRAAEAPSVERGHWISQRPECKKENTRCSVVQLMKENEAKLRALLAALRATGELTKELEKIAAVLERTLAKMEFPWAGTTCQKVGDLLIGLHASPRQGLVTSNRAEHGSLGTPLGYAVDLLPVGGTRLV
jgi:hypothetical protein